MSFPWTWVRSIPPWSEMRPKRRSSPVASDGPRARAMRGDGRTSTGPWPGKRRARSVIAGWSRAKVRLKAKHERVMRDMEHKISRAVVDVAVEHKAGTIVIGDVRDVADGVDLGKTTNQKISGWNHGKVRRYVEYKAEAEGVAVELEDEAYTSQTCPSCRGRHKPKGRRYRCPACGLQAHRDVIGQVNILSRFKHGEPGKVPAPAVVKYRIPHDVRVMSRCPDTGQAAMPVARESSREATAL